MTLYIDKVDPVDTSPPSFPPPSLTHCPSILHFLPFFFLFLFSTSSSFPYVFFFSSPSSLFYFFTAIYHSHPILPFLLFLVSLFLFSSFFLFQVFLIRFLAFSHLLPFSSLPFSLSAALPSPSHPFFFLSFFQFMRFSFPFKYFFLQSFPSLLISAPSSLPSTFTFLPFHLHFIPSFTFCLGIYLSHPLLPFLYLFPVIPLYPQSSSPLPNLFPSSTSLRPSFPSFQPLTLVSSLPLLPVHPQPLSFPSKLSQPLTPSPSPITVSLSPSLLTSPSPSLPSPYLSPSASLLPHPSPSPPHPSPSLALTLFPSAWMLFSVSSIRLAVSCHLGLSEPEECVCVLTSRASLYTMI